MMKKEYLWNVITDLEGTKKRVIVLTENHSFFGFIEKVAYQFVKIRQPQIDVRDRIIYLKKDAVIGINMQENGKNN